MEEKGAMFGMVREGPAGVKKRQVPKGSGAGRLGNYPDTDSEISSNQNTESGKIKAHPLKPGQRQ